ncbi:MAG: hypothetical protein COY69_00600 [Candidatus Magasanikbacteria bacterium CG_4_10_14_0_8_um_filter_32_14]|uniref:GIY-YIG domain-containing protein n=2 Tax=Candidatus Magasanikiibacteriota TaxID=1752731 RepID=A0A2M7RA65_9BACT|nr:MAG: hypothetical protein AUJ23_03955 [Candidatus Magasanikbacteria bacterium CG1_02_32_51]PIY93640.1 MAG: hypothetical protein COY69_00600 [Candidatus Magasanikbacteria bacterium CG_4_10_14_0_8_um_filter_32_14]
MYGKNYYVYIMSNQYHTVFYIGMTNSLERRMLEHTLTKNNNSFTSKYKIKELLYYEEYSDPASAISREKQLKGWRREKKLELIKKLNPELKNLLQED